MFEYHTFPAVQKVYIIIVDIVGKYFYPKHYVGGSADLFSSPSFKATINLWGTHYHLSFFHLNNHSCEVLIIMHVVKSMCYFAALPVIFIIRIKIY